METKTGKRMVSRVAYLKMQSKLISLRAGNIILFASLCAAICAGVAIALTYGVIEGIQLAILLVPVLGGANYLGIKLTEAIALKSRELENVVPFTRANPADLPAPDSLVRASEEPLQAQQAVLLRVAQGRQTPPEELVRASAGQE